MIGSGKITLDLLRKADISAIEEQLPPGQESFYRSVEVSFRFLTGQMQERYKALAVLLEDMAAPLPVLQVLWGIDESEARRTSRHFVDRSLAQREGAAESIRLHDLQLDYVRAQCPDKQALELIHEAVRYSGVIAKDAGQLVSQMVGRLSPYDVQPTIGEFLKKLCESARFPWLRPLFSTVRAPAGEFVRTLAGHTGTVNAVAVTPDGGWAVSASSDHTLKVWEVESGRELRTLEGHTDWVRGVALSGDGRRAVSASDDHTLKVWDLQTGKVVATFTCDSAAICCAYSDALKLIVAGDVGGHIHFLRLEEPKPKS
jgi:WD40 repeat protein